MKGKVLEQFCTEWIIKIEDLTPFVQNEHAKVKAGKVDELILPYESILQLDDIAIEQRIGMIKNNE